MALTQLYESNEIVTLAETDDQVGSFTFNESYFNRAIKRIFKKKGYTEEFLTNKEGVAMIEETYRILSEQVIFSERTPAKVKEIIENNLWRFSGFKTDTQLRDVARKLYDADGHLRSFDDFANDIKQIHHTYNMTYLRSEYDHVARSVEMFNLWQDIPDDAELQYRTMGDAKVRDEHKRLEGVTLPKLDPFWDDFYPPNGWNCRCTVREVRTGKYKQSNSKEAIRKGNAATKLPKQQIFRCNPGKTLNLMPDKHPYYPKGCGDCQANGYNQFDPKADKCKTCKIINKLKPKR